MSLLHVPVASHASCNPDQLAVVASSGRTLTYGELTRSADRMAARLRGLGAGPDVPVALLLPRSVELIAAVLGVLRAGSAYVPLDPSLPPVRLNLLLAQSGARVVLVDAATEALLSPTAASLVRVAEALGERSAGSCEACDASLDPRHLAALRVARPRNSRRAPPGLSAGRPPRPRVAARAA